MEITAKEYTKHGCQVREELPPDGWVVISICTPHSCPWDYYGLKHNQEISNVMKAAGIQCVSLHTRSTVISPMGSGPGGRVRFGDNMTPGLYRVAVPQEDQSAAQIALNHHNVDIQDWLHNGGAMPEACRQ